MIFLVVLLLLALAFVIDQNTALRAEIKECDKIIDQFASRPVAEPPIPERFVQDPNGAPGTGFVLRRWEDMYK